MGARFSGGWRISREKENTLNTGSAIWLLNHNHRYLHSSRQKKLMLSDGVLMCNVQEAYAADVSASTKPVFWKLAAPRIEVIHVRNPPLVWRCICHWCSCAGAILSGKHGSWQHWWFASTASWICTKILHHESLNPRCSSVARVWKISTHSWPAAVAAVVQTTVKSRLRARFTRRSGAA